MKTDNGKKVRKPFKRSPYISRTPTVRANGEPRQRDGAIDGRTNATIVKKLEDFLRIGASYKQAAIHAGISESTFHRWMSEGEKAPEGTPAHTFTERMCKAENEPIIRAKMIIANDTSIETARWFVSRRCPEFSQKVKVGSSSSQSETAFTDSTETNLPRRIKALLKKYPDLLKS